MILLAHSSKRYPSLAVAFLLAFAAVLTAIPRAGVAATTGTGIVIPLYTYPTDGSWTTVINTHNSYPTVPLIVIADPTTSGAGSSSDSNFVTGIKNMQAAGITVIGYVDTVYAGRSLSSAKSDIANWWNWYRVNGIFFDEMSNFGGDENYYSTLTAYAKSLGMTHTMGNPGTTIPTSYIGTVDIICEYESAGLPSLSLLQSIQSGFSKSNFAYLAYSVSTLSKTFEASSSSYAGWLYITNDGGGNPWDTLPPYFSSEMAALDPVATSSTTTTTTTSSTATTSTSTGSTASLSISTVDASNQALTGFYIQTVQDNTAGTSTGGYYTPKTVGAVAGHSYSVTVDDYGGYNVVGANIGTFARTSANGGGGTATFTLQGNANIAFTLSTSTTSSTTITTTSTTSPSTTTVTITTTSPTTTTKTTTTTTTITTTTSSSTTTSSTTTSSTSSSTSASTTSASSSTSTTSSAATQLDFSLVLSQASQHATEGKGAFTQVQVNYLSGTSSTVTLAILGLSSGITAVFSPTSGTAPFSSTLTVSTSTSTPAGTYYLTITGTSGQLIKEVQYSLKVTKTSYTMTIRATPSNGGTTSPAPGTYTYLYNSSCVITAVPDSGWHLEGWTVNGGNSGNGSVISFVVSNDTLVTATFALGAPMQGVSTISFATNGALGIHAIVDGTNYTIPASFTWQVGSKHLVSIATTVFVGPTTKEVFTGWSGSDPSPSTQLAVVVSGDSQVTANYMTEYQATLGFTTAEGERVVPSSITLLGPSGESTIPAGDQAWLRARSTYTLLNVMWSNVSVGLINPGNNTLYLDGPASYVIPLMIYRDTFRAVDLFGLPLGGVTVNVTAANGGQITKLTDSNGIATFELPLGSYSAVLTYMGVTMSHTDQSFGPHDTAVTFVLSFPIFVVLGLFAASLAAVAVGRRRHRSQADLGPATF